MRAAFLGTPSAAVPALAALADVADVDVVITQPDAPRGRSGKPVPPPVKLAAAEFGYDTAQPADGRQLAAELEGRQLDVAVVVAYGRLLSREVLGLATFGFVNVHFSLLPRWRGAAPVERAILAGDEHTGITLMQINEGLDTGPVIAIAETPIEDDETAGSLTARLAYLGAEVLSRTLPEFLAGRRPPSPQLATGVTTASRLTTAEAELMGEDDAETMLRKVRAFNPRPGAWLDVDGTRLKVWSAAPSAQHPAAGTIAAGREGPILGTRDGALLLTEVQAPGKGRADGASWMRGRHVDEIVLDWGDQSI